MSTPRRRQVDFDADATVFGTSLSEELDRREESVTALLEHKLTTLTTLVLKSDIQRDLFDYSPTRDAQRVLVAPGVQFKPHALVSGSAFVGYRRFEPTGAPVAPLATTYASVDLGYTLRRTRFAVQSQRDVEHSFDPSHPFYVSTGVTGSVSQVLSRNWTATARAGKQRLNYSQGVIDAIGQPGRVETVQLYGGGFAYSVSPDIQVGVTADYYRRTASAEQRGYEGLRIGSFVSYGIRELRRE